MNQGEVDYMCRPVSIQQPKNFTTLFENNVKEIKYVREKLEQNKKELKNIEVIQKHTK